MTPVNYREILRGITPPVIINLRRSLKRRVLPRWYQVEQGILKGQWLFVSLSDGWARTMLRGTYEVQMVTALASRVKPGWICFDIGAHIGYYSLLMSKLSGLQGQVHAFEPFPYTVDYLHRHLERNNLTSIHVHPIAIADANGSATIQGISSVGKNVLAFLKGVRVLSSSTGESAVPQTVDQRRIDDLVEQQLVPTPHVIKVDVEGAELPVLLGARRTLQRAKPVVVVELHTAANAVECVAFLQGVGYQVRLLDSIADDRCQILAEP